MSALAIRLTWATSSAPGSFGASGGLFSQWPFLAQPFPSTSSWLKRGTWFIWVRRYAWPSRYVTAPPGLSLAYSGDSLRPVVLPLVRSWTNPLPILKLLWRILATNWAVANSCRSTSGLSSFFSSSLLLQEASMPCFCAARAMRKINSTNLLSHWMTDKRFKLTMTE